MDKLTLALFAAILVIHWVADFVMQTDEESKKKSTSWFFLLKHTFTYSIVWMLPACVIFGLMNRTETTAWYVSHTLFFVMITFMSHTVTDYFTSRLNSRLWEKGDVHNFFVSIGFDQILHYIQILLTFYLLQ